MASDRFFLFSVSLNTVSSRYFEQWYLKLPSYIKEYSLNTISKFIKISYPDISNYWYLKVNFLVPENLLWDISSLGWISTVLLVSCWNGSHVVCNCPFLSAATPIISYSECFTTFMQRRARPRSIIGISFRYSLTWRHAVCSHFESPHHTIPVSI